MKQNVILKSKRRCTLAVDCQYIKMHYCYNSVEYTNIVTILYEVIKYILLNKIYVFKMWF